MFNTIVIFYQLFSGLATALCATTGKYVGAGDGRKGRELVAWALALAVALAALVSAGMWLLRVQIGRLYTDDAAVIASLERNMIGAAMSVPGYAVFMTLYGACRGVNKQRTAALCCGTGYAIGIPLAYCLGVRRHWPTPLLGVWCGNAVALAWAAAWTLLFVSCGIEWARLRPVASLHVQQDGASSARTRFLDEGEHDDVKPSTADEHRPKT
jgi:MATE family multidrug resistance protein